ncbi:MAG: lysylphosphatidylglycerol synthase transmembrane domain-containing protein [Alphaproteobacteria bacterium]
MNSKWRLFLKLVVSVALIAGVVALVDLRVIAANLSRVHLVWLLPAGLLIWSTNFVSAWRWAIVVRSLGPRRKQPPSYWILWRLYWIGQFFNQLLPSGLGGDGVRMWLIQRAGLPTGAAITSVLVDRIFAMTAMMLLVAIVTPLAFNGPGAEPLWLWVIVASCALGVVTLVGFNLLPVPLRLSGNPAVRAMRRISGDLWKIIMKPGDLLAILCASVVVQMIGAAAVFLIAQSFDVQIGFLQCLALMPIVVLATAVPISIAGWGVREVAMVVVLASVGVAREHALLIAVSYGGLAVAISLPGSALWLLERRGDRKAAEPKAPTAKLHAVDATR